MTVDRIMNAQLSILKISDSMDMAGELMIDTAVQYIPVVGDEGQPFGLVCQADLFAQADSTSTETCRKPSGPGTMELSDIMRTNIDAVSPGIDLRHAAITLQEKMPDCLLVVEENKLIRILTSSDFLDITISLFNEREQEPETSRYDDLEEDVEIEELNEDDLEGVFVEKIEDEDWDRMDL